MKDWPELAVERIIADLCDRRGLRQEFEAIDEEIQQEITDTWVEIVRKTFHEVQG